MLVDGREETGSHLPVFKPHILSIVSCSLVQILFVSANLNSAQWQESCSTPPKRALHTYTVDMWEMLLSLGKSRRLEVIVVWHVIFFWRFISCVRVFWLHQSMHMCIWCMYLKKWIEAEETNEPTSFFAPPLNSLFSRSSNPGPCTS